MIEVPFEKIGAGQSVRVACQVMGRNGPVHNPQGIRFMRPEDVPASLLPSPFDLTTVVAGLNLVVSIGTIALSAMTLHEIRRVSRQLGVMDGKLDVVNDKVDLLLKKVEVVDTKVSENNLRHALAHVLKSSLEQDQISISNLVVVLRDVEYFSNSVPDFQIGGALGLRMSSDVLHHMGLITNLLSNLRCLIFCRHNQLVNGDPRCTISLNPIEDYLSYGSLRERAQSIYAIDRALHTRESADKVLDVYDPMMMNVIRKRRHELDSIRCAEDFAAAVGDYRETWLWHTDAGLLWRTICELRWAKNGYHCQNLLEASPLHKVHQLDVACEFPKEAA